MSPPIYLFYGHEALGLEKDSGHDLSPCPRRRYRTRWSPESQVGSPSPAQGSPWVIKPM